MSSATKPTIASATRREPILICYDGSAGFEAEPRGELASATWQGIVGGSDEFDAAAIVIGSRGLTGMKKIFDASVSRQVAEHAGRPVPIVPPLR
jgi:nucleotide-binding universal stress UspA family protein